jgi:hypothetical protein
MMFSPASSMCRSMAEQPRFFHAAGTLNRFAHTNVTRKLVELGLLPQRAPFARGTSG